ncbi:MAG: GTPase HflX [Bernardetiaceae bacterium]|nr:GTPase HflX [Bernardetiaceae bacterium]
MIQTPPIKSEEMETAVLVALINKEQPAYKAKEYLDELAFLAQTLNIEAIEQFTQKIPHPDIRTFVRKGKIEEIREFTEAKNVKYIIFDDELSPRHVRNLEQEFKGKIVLDRSLLILEIFSYRAQTAQARTQVDLARNQYILPRLTGMWTHLSRQRGGIGQRGAGEKEIETDRRIVNNQIKLLKDKLRKIEKQGETRSKQRHRMVRVALVGYTNVGKSTLMRLLTKADVFAENKLFATVDATIRRVQWGQMPFLLTDTVGFIRKLPTLLIECFKSTLSEIVEADILLHVVDVSHPAFEDHIKVVEQTLDDIGASNKPSILVCNKIDAYKDNMIVGDNYLICPPSLTELRDSYLDNEKHRAIFISAAQKENIEELRSVMQEMIAGVHGEIYPNYLPN